MYTCTCGLYMYICCYHLADKCLSKLVNIPLNEFEDVSTLYVVTLCTTCIHVHACPSCCFPYIVPPSLPLCAPVVQEFFCAYLEDSPCLKAQELLVMHHLSHHRYADAITMQDKIKPLAMVHVYTHQRMSNQLSCLVGSCTMYTPLSCTMYTPRLTLIHA